MVYEIFSMWAIISYSWSRYQITNMGFEKFVFIFRRNAQQVSKSKQKFREIVQLWSNIHFFSWNQNLKIFCNSPIRYNADVKSSSSPTNSYENVILDQMTSEEKAHQVFMERPFCEYSGHTSDLLDVSWSKNYFILTSSMDKTVRLWHISRYRN